MPSKSQEQMISFGFIPVFPQQCLKGCTGSVIYSQTSAFQQDLTPFSNDIVFIHLCGKEKHVAFHGDVASWLCKDVMRYCVTSWSLKAYFYLPSYAVLY